MMSKDKNFEAAKSWNYERFASMEQSRNRAWGISFFCMAATGLSLTTLIFLMPLKTSVPYVVTVDRGTGYLEVTKGLYDSNLSADQAVTESNLVRYVSARESYNPAILRENYDFTALMSDEQALAEYQNLWDGQNPDNPSRVLGPTASISIQIKSVSFLNDKTASVRFIREQRDHERVTTSHWNAVVVFRYVQKPTKMADRFQNPLGFKVTSYRLNPEMTETSQ